MIKDIQIVGNDIDGYTFFVSKYFSREVDILTLELPIVEIYNQMLHLKRKKVRIEQVYIPRRLYTKVRNQIIELVAYRSF